MGSNVKLIAPDYIMNTIPSIELFFRGCRLTYLSILLLANTVFLTSTLVS
jgi:hypothetical protein